MYTGRLIEDLFDTVEKAERSARASAIQNQPPLPSGNLHVPGNEIPSELEEAALATK